MPLSSIHGDVSGKTWMQSVILGSAGAQLRQSPRPTPLLGEAGKPSRERTELLVNIDPRQRSSSFKCASLAGISVRPVRPITD